MAFNMGSWLEKLRDEKTADGKPKYSTETLQDLIALIIFSSGESLDGFNEPVTGILGAFAGRSGLADAKAEEYPAKFNKYFDEHPVPKELVDSFQAQFKRDPGNQLKQVLRMIRG
jgi:hypothetical protein